MLRTGYKSLVYGLVAMSLFAVVACAGTPPTARKVDQQCEGPFNVAVRKGTNQGLAVKGMLVYVLHDATKRIGGALIPTGTEKDVSKHIKMEGTVKDGKINMTFTLPDKRAITGTGDFPKDGRCVKDLNLTGEAKGPAPDDTGDWDGNLGVAAYYLAGYVCFAACSYAGESDATCNRECGFNS